MEDTSVQGFLLVAGLVFGVVSLIHLVRAINSWEFVIGPLDLPVTASWVGFLVTLGLCLWAFWLLL
ncbi:MAG: hypothetical protein QGI68_06570 [Pseudomonadales bacterium]|jgi:hypothetical protein|nr:hypothetical protein [Pseudomonadales bacterium]MDP7360403.1 hypothetical protein [Pseudomonadales bacterium]MDP7595217.1 hypothetical protein [Pseudomonadales bacterium]HJN53125.1 hypothetical protein [Pseudomonadales bacterium]|tara:strand:+ start:2550 stop:2747 length:198 start_codon:yes stop_codon:yes gene_type:complete